MKAFEAIKKFREATAPVVRPLGCGAQLALMITGFCGASYSILELLGKYTDSVQTLAELDQVNNNLKGLDKLLEINRERVQDHVTYHYLFAQEACKEGDTNEMAYQYGAAETFIVSQGCTSQLDWSCQDGDLVRNQTRNIFRAMDHKFYIGLAADFRCPTSFAAFLDAYPTKNP